MCVSSLIYSGNYAAASSPTPPTIYSYTTNEPDKRSDESSANNSVQKSPSIVTCNERGITVFELFGEKYLAAMDKYIRIGNTRNEKQNKKKKNWGLLFCAFAEGSCFVYITHVAEDLPDLVRMAVVATLNT